MSNPFDQPDRFTDCYPPLDEGRHTTMFDGRSPIADHAKYKHDLRAAQVSKTLALTVYTTAQLELRNCGAFLARATEELDALLAQAPAQLPGFAPLSPPCWGEKTQPEEKG